MGQVSVGGVKTSMIDTQLWAPVAYGPHGNAHILNTPVFILAWDLIGREGKFRKFDWTLKLDVDAVIVVQRMKSVLMSHAPDQEVVLWNTPQDAVGNLLHGPVEVLSQAAVEAYFIGQEKCKQNVNYAKEGEDYYLGFCMKYLKVQGVYEARLLQDAYMWGKRHVDCNTQHAVFHPVKNAGELSACVNLI